jgi:predicted Zn-dependent protease
MAALCLLAPAGLAKDKKPKAPEDRDPGKGINFYSIEKEIALGRGMADEVELESRLEADPIVTEYINRIGQNIVRNSDAKVPFTIKVIDSEEVNAFALPGGYMFVNTGLVLKADNEAELAGVLSHEIAHVAARHGTKQASRGQLINYASIPLIFIGGWAGYAIREAATLAIPMGFLQFTRSMEIQADSLGLGYLDKSGYDPVSFVDFFERIETIEKKQPGAIAKLFYTHPMTGDRIRRAQKQIERDLKVQPQYVVDTSEFHAVKDRLQAIENRRNGNGIDYRLPQLRRRPQTSNPAPVDDEGRPTLKRQ